MNKDDKLILGGREFSSRFILGSGKYSLNLIEAAVKYAGAEIITLAFCSAFILVRPESRHIFVAFSQECSFFVPFSV